MDEFERGRLAGLQEARVLCHEQSRKHKAAAAGYEVSSEKVSCLSGALATLDCALAIKALMGAAADPAP